ncbi:hypothetical protein DL93DRAFT_2083105 [Clavulina sp. PMI_390]|nr:hypothetical protein DL93DRAFT_2083105 [Clavulina sp. PMI_390]
MKRVLNIVHEAQTAGLSEKKTEAVLDLAASHKSMVLSDAYSESDSGIGGWDFFPIYSQNHVQDGNDIGMGKGEGLYH